MIISADHKQSKEPVMAIFPVHFFPEAFPNPLYDGGLDIYDPPRRSEVVNYGFSVNDA
ncbi:MAG: hypothetical protein WBE10_06075 [Candidatus Acidiferrum sp.]